MSKARGRVDLALGVVGVGLGLYRLAHWWQHSKDGPATGYVNGEPFALTLVTIDGKPVEVETAAAYQRMRQAAALAGVRLKIVSGFRTMAEQEHFYRCYLTADCNNGNYAERPGHSKHQSGHALDLNTRAAGVNQWMLANANAHGFYATVPSEPWHWEYWGRSPPFQA